MDIYGLGSFWNSRFIYQKCIQVRKGAYDTFLKSTPFKNCCVLHLNFCSLNHKEQHNRKQNSTCITKLDVFIIQTSTEATLGGIQDRIYFQVLLKLALFVLQGNGNLCKDFPLVSLEQSQCTSYWESRKCSHQPATDCGRQLPHGGCVTAQLVAVHIYLLSTSLTLKASCIFTGPEISNILIIILPL